MGARKVYAAGIPITVAVYVSASMSVYSQTKPVPDPVMVLTTVSFESRISSCSWLISKPVGSVPLKVNTAAPSVISNISPSLPTPPETVKEPSTRLTN